MSYRNISNWPAARIFRQSKHLGGEIGILKDVTFSLFGCRKQSISYGSPGLITLLFGLLVLSACAGLPVRGMVGGQTIETRVDSEAARYYLEHYLPGNRTDPALDERIDRVYQSANGHLPDRSDLKHLSDDFSVDFAALYFADQIARIPVNRRFRSAFERAYDYALKAYPEGRVSLSTEYEVMFVPTYLYKRLFSVGADMAVPRAAIKKVGLTGHFVETQDDGAVETNADLVAAAIRSRAQSGRRLIIISASKSGPEVALALTKLGPAGTRHVAAWINAMGALQGTPLVDDRLFPDLEILMGKVDIAGTESMTTARGRRRFDSFHVPDHLLVVNYFGVPVVGSVSFWARTSFFPLRKYGPNDGTVLLPDMIFPGGVTLTELGSDHFMRRKPLDIVTVALAITVIDWLEHPDGELVRRPGG
ncbi:MAG TPA: hypothetical protein VN957_21705 [Chthoniobacterales bacterium]|nr:hypothetical protein [Chthoniobacterales bacterium]